MAPQADASQVARDIGGHGPRTLRPPAQMAHRVEAAVHRRRTGAGRDHGLAIGHEVELSAARRQPARLGRSLARLRSGGGRSDSRERSPLSGLHAGGCRRSGIASLGRPIDAVGELHAVSTPGVRAWQKFSLGLPLEHQPSIYFAISGGGLEFFRVVMYGCPGSCKMFSSVLVV